eukprot:UN23826
MGYVKVLFICNSRHVYSFICWMNIINEFSSISCSCKVFSPGQDHFCRKKLIIEIYWKMSFVLPVNGN